MQIWIDGDSCPRIVKEILFKAAERCRIPLTLVANQKMYVPDLPGFTMVLVEKGFDIADEEIARRVNRGDLVITDDIPLADIILEKGGQALSFRGELFSADNIKTKLSMRDLLDTLRSSGEITGGPPPLSHKDRAAFANHLDRILARCSRQDSPLENKKC